MVVDQVVCVRFKSLEVEWPEVDVQLCGTEIYSVQIYV